MSSTYITDATPVGGFETITVSSSSIGFTAATIKTFREGGTARRAVRALLTVEGDKIRFRMDGSAPTSTVGHILEVGDNFVVEGDQNIENFRMIRATTDATVQVSYWFNL